MWRHTWRWHEGTPVSQPGGEGLGAKVNLAGLGDAITPQTQPHSAGKQSLAKGNSEPPASEQWVQCKEPHSAWALPQFPAWDCSSFLGLEPSYDSDQSAESLMTYLGLTVFLLHPPRNKNSFSHCWWKKTCCNRALFHDFLVQREFVSVPKKLCPTYWCYSTKIIINTRPAFVPSTLVNPPI